MLLDRREQCLGPTAVHQGGFLGILEKRFEVEKTPFVLRPQGDALGVALCKVRGKGHGRPGPSAIKQCPVVTCLLHGLDHRDNRGDADTLRYEAVVRRVD